ncbi:hypothetical protein B0H16DRAFT_1735344 [Mycena metata]|uniref:Nephrocystin 3-like N-terminal domain-containing protein n=1 Tax=Mycena metata TaxID=1033252 RepID=A0AAD7MQ29_9AGAR|nr:hypothetical protein B0H16DRAFT_1735344 [Mycena metata]
MLRRTGESYQTVNTYISGGVGGNGGSGGIQGGAAGTGEGPSMNYDFTGVGNLTMNNHDFRVHDSNLYTVAGDVSLTIQNNRLDESRIRLPPFRTLELAADSRELSGPMRNLQHRMQMRSGPYDIPSRPRPSVTGFDPENLWSGTDTSFPRRSILAPDPLPYTAAQLNPNTVFSRSPSPPPTFEYQQRTNEEGINNFSTLWPGKNNYPTFTPPQSLHGGTFITGETVNLRHGEPGIHILHHAVALEALYDSTESFPQPKCHPETRTELLNKVLYWATAPESEYAILWLHGPAGAGKSAVMQTMCQRLQDAGRLGGSFFFKRGHPTCGNAKVLFATLAYQLALHRHELNTPISRIAEMDPSVLGRSMDVQLRRLILEPCKMLQDDTPSILLIDGLDECEGHNIQREILRLIGYAANYGSRLRILVASRPEPHIRETLGEELFCDFTTSIDIRQSYKAVRTYLHAEFSRIHREHTTMRNIPTPWPSPEILEMLVENSSGYFIYASTIIKFIEDEYSRPFKRLDIIQNLVPCDDPESPFKTLDQLYIHILRDVPVRNRPRLCDILSVILNFPSRQGISVLGIEALLGLEPGEVSLILRPLHSVLRLISERPGWIEVYHASFRDFLNKQERSLDFYVGSPTHRAKLACSILNALASTHQDSPRKDPKEWWFTWTLGEKAAWIVFMASIPPSADFVPLIRAVNPDFVFFWFFPDDAIESFLIWLKRIQPIPEDLIHRWEDYRFMHSYQIAHGSVAQELLQERKMCPERTNTQILNPSLYVIHTLHGRINSELQATLVTFRELLSRSPHMIYFFQAIRLLISDNESYLVDGIQEELFFIRIVLDLSWDDIQECICSLRPLVGQEPLFFLTILLFLPTFCRELGSLYPEPIVSRDLARGSIRLIRWIKRGNLPEVAW